MDKLTQYLPPDALSYITDLIKLVPVGLLLALVIWLIASLIRVGFDIIRKA